MPIESKSQSRLSATRKRKLLPLERFSIQFPRCRKEEEESINIKASLKFNYSLSDSDDENIIWVSLNFHPTELTLINERLFKNSILFNQLCKKNVSTVSRYFRIAIADKQRDLSFPLPLDFFGFGVLVK